MITLYLVMAVLVFAICLVQQLRSGDKLDLAEVGLMLLAYLLLATFWPWALLGVLWYFIGDNL